MDASEFSAEVKAAKLAADFVSRNKGLIGEVWKSLNLQIKLS